MLVVMSIILTLVSLIKLQPLASALLIQMAAYAALASLINIMEQIKNHPRLTFAFDAKQIESLGEKIRFLLDFIEEANSGGSRPQETEADLERKIARAAHSVEDAIESHVVDQIHAAASISKRDLRGEIKRMDFFKKRVIKFKQAKESNIVHATSSRPRITTNHDKKSVTGSDELIQHMERLQMESIEQEYKEKVGSNGVTYSMDATSPHDKKSTMIGFDDELIKLMEMLVGQDLSRQIITVDGMGGIGKTTLAKNTYVNPTIVQQFDIRAWVTVSQTYTAKTILLQLLTSCQSKSADDTKDEDYQLGEKLHKILSGRSYLIVLDDVWSVDAWEKIMFFFPDNHNRSRIVVTTRLSNMATHFGPWCLSMNLLDEAKSWNLFREKAFGEQGRIAHPELEKIGKEITKKCKGLPLSITVIGGLLRKSSMAREYWENVAEDINSILSSGDDKDCMNILSLSYTHLSAHLKPCFLYMGVFPEDHDIRLSRLVKLLVAEGFLKPNETKSPEEIAESYVMDLYGRNLILARRWGMSGKLKACGIHDLIRDLCMKIAEEEKFLRVINSYDNNIPGDMTRDRRLVLDDYRPEDFDVLQSASLVRSLICGVGWKTSSKLRLLRVLDEVKSDYRKICFQQVNLRYLAVKHIPMEKLSSSIFLLWNLQTLIGTDSCFAAPMEIWEMPQLRHLEFGNIHLPDPPSGLQQHGFGLRNLQTLTTLVNTRLSEELCQGIPNVRRLGLYYIGELQVGYDCFRNLGRLDKLKRLSLSFDMDPNRDDLLRNLRLPSSLRKLTLSGCMLVWEDLAVIGSLPNLQILHLSYRSARGSEWSPIEGHFLSLKCLKISTCHELIRWNADNFHFPVLEKLFMETLYELEAIPLGIGEIPTLRLIHLSHCSESCAISALEILEEQEGQDNEGLQVRLQFWHEAEMESFKKKVEPTSNNVQLGVYSEDFRVD